MGTVVIHAGMPKAGSSSVQTWLEKHAEDLARNHDIVVLSVSQPSHSTEQSLPILGPHDQGNPNSGIIIRSYVEAEAEAEKRKVVDAFLERLDFYACQHQTIVVTSEAYAQPYWRVDRTFLGGLDDLAHKHNVRVAYYVRPQHTALEAAWRQWGFRTGISPVRYIRRRARQLHYFKTWCAVNEAAPGISFEPRPFRVDLLDGGEVVTDFAARYLHLNDKKAMSGSWSNQGLPIEVVNVLAAPLFQAWWGSPHDNLKLRRVKHLIKGISFPSSEKMRLSRLILQAYCYNIFEQGNRHLIGALGWNSEAFVPPVEAVDAGELPGLSTLDELWRPDASAGELLLLRTALAAAVDAI